MEHGIQSETFVITGVQLPKEKGAWVTLAASTTLSDGERRELWRKEYELPALNLTGTEFIAEMRDVLVALIEAL